MASDLIDVLLKVPNVASVTVVGVDHRLITDLQNPRLNSIQIEVTVDINSDLAFAIRDEKKIAIFLPDLPSVTATEISIALELAGQNETSFIPDQSAIGSTAFFSTVGKVRTYFGTDSAAAHRSNQATELVHQKFKGINADCDDWSDLLALDSADLGWATSALMEHHLQK